MPERNKIGIFIFECEEIHQFSLTLEYNSKIAVGEFILHYTIKSIATLKRKLTQIWQSYHQVIFRHYTYNNFLR